MTQKSSNVRYGFLPLVASEKLLREVLQENLTNAERFACETALDNVEQKIIDVLERQRNNNPKAPEFVIISTTVIKLIQSSIAKLRHYRELDSIEMIYIDVIESELRRKGVSNLNRQNFKEIITAQTKEEEQNARYNYVATKEIYSTV